MSFHVTHLFITSFQLKRNDSENQMTVEHSNQRLKYFVWDNVSLAFHVDDQVILSDRAVLSWSCLCCFCHLTIGLVLLLTIIFLGVDLWPWQIKRQPHHLQPGCSSLWIWVSWPCNSSGDCSTALAWIPRKTWSGCRGEWGGKYRGRRGRRKRRVRETRLPLENLSSEFVWSQILITACLHLVQNGAVHLLT